MLIGYFMYKYRSTEMQICNNTEMYYCICAEIQKYRAVEIHYCIPVEKWRILQVEFSTFGIVE